MADSDGRDLSAWPTDGDYPPEWVRDAHKELVEGGGMLGVVYRRQLQKIKELRDELHGDNH